MNVPSRHRRPGPIRLLKVSAAAGIAAVGTTALGFAVSGEDNGTVHTAGSELPMRPVAWEAGPQSGVQKAGIDAQSSRADDRARDQARSQARDRAEQQQEREAAARAAAEEQRRAEAAAKKRQAELRAARQQEEEKRRAEREKADGEQARTEAAPESARGPQAASRSAKRENRTVPSGSPQEIARQIIGNAAEFRCFSQIVRRESGWNPRASNASSGAYGLMQALPGSKMSSAGADWKTNPTTQIKWGLNYMTERYGSPCGAWKFWQANNWY